MCHLRRSLPGAQERAVPSGSGGGVPDAREAALHAVSAGALPVRTGGGDAVQRGRGLLLDAAGGQPQWQATLFGAAQDAKQGKLWPSQQHWWQRLSTPCRRTQGRRLEMAGRLTGGSPELEERQREQIATRLSHGSASRVNQPRRKIEVPGQLRQTAPRRLSQRARDGVPLLNHARQ